MLFHEMEIAEPRPRARAAWLELSTSRLWPALEAEGARVLAVFGTVFGRTSEITTIYEYADAAVWQRTRLRLATPGAGFAGFDEREALTERLTTRTLVPSPYWPVRPIPTDGLFTSRIFRIEPGTLERFHRHTAEIIWPFDLQQDDVEFVALWTSAIGNAGDCIALVRYRDFGHWDRTHPNQGKTDDPTVAKWLEALRERDRSTLGTEVRLMRRLPVWPPADR